MDPIDDDFWGSDEAFDPDVDFALFRESPISAMHRSVSPGGDGLFDFSPHEVDIGSKRDACLIEITQQPPAVWHQRGDGPLEMTLASGCPIGNFSLQLVYLNEQDAYVPVKTNHKVPSVVKLIDKKTETRDDGKTLQFAVRVLMCSRKQDLPFCLKIHLVEHDVTLFSSPFRVRNRQAAKSNFTSEAKALLAKLQWSGPNDTCLVCGARRMQGHLLVCKFSELVGNDRRFK